MKIKPEKTVGLIAQLVEHCTVSQRSWVRIPFWPEFSQALFSQLLQAVVVFYCDQLFLVGLAGFLVFYWENTVFGCFGKSTFSTVIQPG